MFTSSRYIKSDHVTMVTEDEQYEGMWWVYDRPDNTVSGSLHITQQGIRLSLNGTLNTDRRSIELVDYDLIHGVQFNGARLTLEKCSEARNQKPFGNGYDRQDFVVQRVYSGLHADSPDNLRFNDFRVNYTYLSDWLRNIGLSSPQKKNEGFLIPYDPNRADSTTELVVEIEEISIEISSKPLWYQENHRKVGLEIRDITKIHCKAPISIQELSEKALDPLRNFLSLATARPNSITSLSAIVSENHTTKVITIYTQSPYLKELYSSPSNQGVILFFASQVVDQPTYYLKKWFALEKEMPDVCELFFGVHQDQGAFSTNRFLNVVQALEAYSRFRYGRHNCPPDEHQMRVDAVVNTAPKKHKNWLTQTLSFSNHKPLKKRLIELVDQAKPLADDLIPNAVEFSKWVADTRNYLTHRDRKGKKRIASGEHLEAIIHSLLWLLRIQFLLEVGFTHGKCFKLLAENRVFQDLCSYIKQETEWGNHPEI